MWRVVPVGKAIKVGMYNIGSIIYSRINFIMNILLPIATIGNPVSPIVWICFGSIGVFRNGELAEDSGNIEKNKN